ncbi:MAG: TIGR03618 family F420-dependent PPOX class oxidoreductase [Ilumatobacteraceae bacterium]
MSVLDDIDPELLANTTATLTTLGPHGDPQMTIVWFIIEDGQVLISAMERRQKTRNVVADGRCSILLQHPATANYYVELRGTADLIDDHDYAIADRIGVRYNADFRRFDGPDDRRKIIAFTPQRAIVTDVR